MSLEFGLAGLYVGIVAPRVNVRFCRVPEHPAASFTVASMQPDWRLAAVVAYPRQGHRLVASGTDVADPSFMPERASLGDSARAAMQVLHARRVRICSSVAS